MNNFFSMNCQPIMLNHTVVIEAVRNFAEANLEGISPERLGDIKVCASEAFTNAVMFAYPEEKTGNAIIVTCTAQDNEMHLTVSDNGIGIQDVKQARTPMFSTKPKNSGMGFTIMESFSNEMDVISKPGNGTIVSMIFRASNKKETT